MRHRKRILIVDDSEIILDVLREFLGQEYVVETMGESVSTMAIVQKKPDAILLDVRMPGVDGLTLLKSLRQMGVQTPIFIMTGYDSKDFAIEALKRGANGYLPKPFDLVHLGQLLADAVGRVPSEVAGR
jgi:two-component system, response regulator, stage 0 sporulation protein F